MKTIKIHWIKQDHLGSVRAAYRRSYDGKLFYPKHLGTVFADLRDITKRNNPGTPFDVETCGAVYLIGGEPYVCEGCGSRVFKPLAAFLASLADRNPVLAASTGGGLANRSALTVFTAPAANTVA